MVFTTPLWGSFSDTRTLAVPIALHIAMLGLVFDFVCNWCREWKLPEPVMTRSIGFIFLFVALAGEASWKLIPTLILSEMPLFYTLIGIFVIMAHYWSSHSRPLCISICLSVALSAHYLIKSQGLAAIPIVAGLSFIGIMLNTTEKSNRLSQALLNAGVVVGPVVCTILLWKIFGPLSSKCAASIEIFFVSGLNQLNQGSPWVTLLSDIADRTANYLGNYKVPVTIISTIGVVSSLFFRQIRYIGLGVIAYFIVYFGAVFWAYLSCPDGFNDYLSSILRYLQPPIRTFHMIGVLLLTLAAIHIMGSNRGFMRHTRRLTFVAVFFAALTGLYQVYGLNRSLKTISAPAIEHKMASYVKTIPRDVEQVLRLAKQNGFENPKALYIFRFWENLPYLIALHHGVPETRNGLVKGNTVSRWRLSPMRYPDKQIAATQTAKVHLPDNLHVFDVIWSDELISDASAEIAGKLTNPECAYSQYGFYATRNRENPDKFDCIARSPA